MPKNNCVRNTLNKAQRVQLRLGGGGKSNCNCGIEGYLSLPMKSKLICDYYNFLTRLTGAPALRFIHMIKLLFNFNIIIIFYMKISIVIIVADPLR